MTDDRSTQVIVGRINGLYGVRGWLKIFSYTESRESIIEYSPWQVLKNGQWQIATVEAGRIHGKGVVVKLIGYDDRDSAATLIGCDIAVSREQIGEPEPGEFYWSDLEGLKVINLEGVELGVVDHLFETGANDVVVVRGERERLLPFLRGEVIKEIDLQRQVMEVDWDPEF